jgi:hypothetical protein
VFDGLVLAARVFLNLCEADFPQGDLVTANRLRNAGLTMLLTLRQMYLMAENLVNAWDQDKPEFKATKTLTEKKLLIAMMYQPWELCNDILNKWSEAKEITLPAKKPLREVAAKQAHTHTHTHKYTHTHHSN